MTGAVGFLDLTEVIVPASLAEYANGHLRRVGKDGNEGFALWAGERHGSIFYVTECIIPAQSGLRYEGGVCVRVEADELFRLNVHLYEAGLQLVAQLHSHPGDAYHSDTDDAFPIATVSGALSLVIPDFAREPFALDRCAVYRLLPARGWVGLSDEESSALIIIDDDEED
jgi:hypothetical protein